MNYERPTKTERHSLSLKVVDFNLRASIHLNHELHDEKYRNPETTIYQQYSSIELHCRNIAPDYPTTDTY